MMRHYAGLKNLHADKDYGIKPTDVDALRSPYDKYDKYLSHADWKENRNKE